MQVAVGCAETASLCSSCGHPRSARRGGRSVSLRDTGSAGTERYQPRLGHLPIIRQRGSLVITDIKVFLFDLSSVLLADSIGRSGTFLTASPSGVLTAATPSRGPLEAFKPVLSPTSPFPSFSFATSSEKYLSVSDPAGPSLGKGRPELRADADSIGKSELCRVKCQREFVLRAKIDQDGGKKVKTKLEESVGGSREDEVRRKSVALLVSCVSSADWTG